MYEDEDNDGKFPDESPVEVRYPRSKQEEQPGRCSPAGTSAIAPRGKPCHAARAQLRHRAHAVPHLAIRELRR